MEDLLGTYKQLEGFGEHSEYFYYRYATFYDGYCESAKEVIDRVGHLDPSFASFAYSIFSLAAR